jgi:hydroxymethylglutaryl-CoA lyase
MGFGNPYGDPYDAEVVGKFVDILNTLGVKIISLADTIGVSSPELITYLFTSLSKQFPSVELGAHLHSNPTSAREKIEAAYNAGCKRFDGALKGFGGCPMAKDELVGNLATEALLDYLNAKDEAKGINQQAFGEAMRIADQIFLKH